MSDSMDKLAKGIRNAIDEKNDRKPKAYDTQAEVISKEGDTLWVHIPGGVDRTPVKRTVDANEGDKIMVRVADGRAWAIGNATNPPTDDAYARRGIRDLSAMTQDSVDFVAALADKDVTVKSITAATGYIDDLYSKDIHTENIWAATGYIDELHSKNITTDNLEATTAYIKDLTAEEIEAGAITTKTLDAKYATINELHADYAHIKDGVIDNAKIGYADVQDLHAHYAALDFANVLTADIQEAWIKDLMVQGQMVAQDGTIYRLTGLHLNANDIDVGQLKADRLLLLGDDGLYYSINVNTLGESYIEQCTEEEQLEFRRTIHADVITANSITVDKITTNNLIGTGGWINLRSGTFAYENASTGDGISWDGQHLSLRGDVEITSNNYYTKTDVDGLIGDIQDQVDGVIDTWYYAVDPTTSNAPASSWTTDNDRYNHLRDLYFNTTNGHSFRWAIERTNDASVVSGKRYYIRNSATGKYEYVPNPTASGLAQYFEYQWLEIKDADAIKALADAKNAQDTADGKRRVFTAQPTNAQEYDVGDLWVNATYGTTYSNDILKCKTKKAAGAAFNISHWALASKYTDDSNVYKKSDFSISPEAIISKVSAIEGWEIGGRNLESWTGQLDKYELLGGPTLDGDAISFPANGTDKWGGAFPSVHLVKYSYVRNKTITMSADVLAANNASCSLDMCVCVSKTAKGRVWWLDRNVRFTGTGDWERITFTQEIDDSTFVDRAGESITSYSPDDLYFGVVWYRTASYNTAFKMKAMKVELGNKATDWTPAPEDTDAKISELNTSIEETAEAIKLEASRRESSVNLLLDSDAPSLTKVYADYNRYMSNGGNTMVTPTYITLNDPPEAGIEHAARFVCDGTNTTAVERAYTFYEATANAIPFVAGQTYTATWWARYTSGTAGTLKTRVVYPKGDGGTNNAASPLYDLTNRWKIYSHTFTIDALNTNYNRIWFDAYFVAGKTGTIEICGCKLIAGDSIEEYKTQILQTADNVLIKATKNDTTNAQGGQHLIESFINVAPEGVKIGASKVAIGDFNNYITVTENDPASLLPNLNYEIKDGWIYKNNADTSNVWMAPILPQWTKTGEQYRVTGTVKAPAAGSVSVDIMGRNSSGAYVGANSTSITISAGTEATFNNIITITSTVSNCPKVNIGIYFRTSSGYQVGYCKDMRVERMSGASLIVDGSITADKIATGAITVGDMNTDTKEAVLNSEIQIGGANILQHTKYMEGYLIGARAHFYNQNSLNTPNYRFVRLTGSTADWDAVVNSTTLPVEYLDGTTKYTLSFEYKSSAVALINTTIGGTARGPHTNGTGRTKYITWTNENIPSSGSKWVKHVVGTRTIKVADLTNGSGDVNSFYIQFYNRSDNVAFDIRNIKLEVGNKATDWSPAVGDEWSSGVNILRGTDKMKGDVTYAKGGFYGSNTTYGTVAFNQSVSNPPVPNATKGIKLTANDSTDLTHGFGFAQQGVPIHKGVVTYSVWAKGSANDRIALQINYIDSKSGKNDTTNVSKQFIIPDSEWNKYEWTKPIDIDYSNPAVTVDGVTYNNAAGYVYFYSETSGHTLTVVAPMLEYGTVSSSWTPRTTESNITRIDDNGIRIHPSSTENNSVLINGNGFYVYQDNIERAYFRADAVAIGTTGQGRAIIKDDGLHVYTYDTAQHDVGFFGSTARVGLGNSSRFLMKADSLEGWNSSNKRYFQVSASGLKYGTDLANTVETTAGAQDKADAAKNSAIETASADAKTKADAAAKTATTYITDIDSKNGITLKDANHTNNYLEIKSGAINIYRNGNLRAQFQNDWLCLGNPSNARFSLKSDPDDMYMIMNDKNNVQRFSLTASGVLIGKAAQGHTYITDAGLHIYDENNKKRSLVDKNGLHVYDTDGSTEVANFGSTARIGAIANGKPRIEVGASSISLIARNSSGTDKSVTLGLKTYSSSQHMRLGSSKTFLTFVDTGNASTSNIWMGMEATGSTDPYLLDLRYGIFSISGDGSENPLSVSRSSGTVSTSYDIALNNNKAIRAMSTGSTLRDLMRLDTGNALVIGYGNYTHPATDANTWLEGYNVYLRAQQKCYANGSQITTSDKRLKKDIVPISDKFKSLFMDLQPVEYKMEQSQDKDIHFGLTAQDVEMAFMKNNISIEKYALVDEYEYPEEKTRYKALAYTEFIPMCIQMIQSQQKELETLKGEINALRRN